ncbi:hypothetical protein KOAAANKH_02286 [Brevundimonas sp. NIBR10]|uniref:hypothetical protein n=1 Tax=Brevundimonas sp. NIBR10 TaxID=3015997 RepID=UPI0022F1DD6C|nr:hypothetical protein [Brevundimonas sp. NIBR10]WGM47409.1 hypothetical protein KOAAANKH_02286 [Brevundimonas sp. NIBR10]
MKFSAGEAAFEGFRVTRQHPRAVAGWTLIWLVSLIATALTALPILGPVMGELQDAMRTAMSGGGSGLPAAIQSRVTYAMLATMPVSLVTQAIVMPALYRAMQSEVRDPFAFVRLGRDELRVLLVLLLLAIISVVLGQVGDTAVLATQGVNLSFVGALIGIATTALNLFVAVRMVLAVPATFSRGRIDLKGAWRLTEGRFWPLFGMAIIAGVMACIVGLLLLIVSLPLSAMMAGAATSPAGAAGALLVLLLMAVGAALVTIILSAPFMAAYRDLTAGQD